MIATAKRFALLGSLMCVCASAAFASATNTALFSEDGSGRVGRWYYSQESSYIMQKSGVLERLQGVAREHDFQLFDVGPYYMWMQDILLFDTNGAFVAQAKYPHESSYFGLDLIFGGLTQGVYSEDGGFLRVPERTATSWAPVARTMVSTLIEGGGLISGVRKNGKPYVLIESEVLKRADAFYARVQHRVVDHKTLHDEIAADVGVAPADLIVIDAPKHLDLFMLALPGGRILVQDHRLVAPVIRHILSSQNLFPNEAIRLKAIADVHEEAINAGKHYHSNATYNAIAAKLAGAGFEVVRVAGDFSDIAGVGVERAERHINFMNSFQGTDPKGRHWMVASPADGLSSLERYWADLINKQKVRSQGSNVYFVGHYTTGMGMDCTGAVSAHPSAPASNSELTNHGSHFDRSP